MNRQRMQYEIAVATTRMQAAAERIGNRLNMEKEVYDLINYMNQPRAHADVQLAEMYKTQAVANFLDKAADLVDTIELQEDDDDDTVSVTHTDVMVVLDENVENELQQRDMYSAVGLELATDDELLAIPGIGPATLQQIREHHPFFDADAVELQEFDDETIRIMKWSQMRDADNDE